MSNSKNKLLKWKSNHMFMGGHIVLVKFVSTSMAIYLFFLGSAGTIYYSESLFKFCCVWYGGTKDVRKIHWEVGGLWMLRMKV